MIDWSLLLSVCVLTNPIDTPLSPLTAAHVKATAVALEILDERECLHMLTRADQHVGDLKLLRTRWESLKGAPLSADAMRFPPKEIVSGWLEHNRVLRSHFKNWQELTGDPFYEEAVLALDERYRFWDSVRDSASPYYHVTVRRKNLKDALDAIGISAYYGGEYPAFVPFELLKPIR